MQSVWMRSRSFFSCALKCANPRTPTVACQRIHAGVGGVATVATMATIHIVPPALPAPLPVPPPSTSTVTIPFCNASGGIIDEQNETGDIDVPASRPTEVLLDVDAEVAGCCIEGTVKVAVNFLPGSPTGFVAVSLESPDLQSAPLGNATDASAFTLESTDILQGAVALGVWKLKLLASSDAAGWVVTFVRFQMDLGQCVWLTWVCQDKKWWKDGCLNQLQKCQMSVSEGVFQMWIFYGSGTPIR